MYSDSDKLADLFVKINGLLVDEKRNVEDVMRYIQRVIDDPDFVQAIDRAASESSDALRNISDRLAEVDERPAEFQTGQLESVEQPQRIAQTNGNTLPADHYRVHVTYAPMPSFDVLKKEFGKDNV